GFFDVRQADQPALWRYEQTGRLLSRRQVQDDPANHPFWIAIVSTAPDLGLAADFQREIKQAVFEVLNACEVGKPAPVSNRDAHNTNSRLVRSFFILLLDGRSKLRRFRRPALMLRQLIVFGLALGCGHTLVSAKPLQSERGLRREPAYGTKAQYCLLVF